MGGKGEEGKEKTKQEKKGRGVKEGYGGFELIISSYFVAL